MATVAKGRRNLISALDHPLRLALLQLLVNEDMRVQELAHGVDAPMNLVSYHLRRLREAGLVRERRSIADGRDLYYSLDVRTLRSAYLEMGAMIHPTLRIDPSCLPRPELGEHPARRVLFLCTHNSARSQMAEAILRARSGGRMDVYSAGTHPTAVHPRTIEVLESRGIRTESLRSKPMKEFEGVRFDYVITVCDRAREECPVFQEGVRQLHWSLPDPVEVEGTAGQKQLAFQRVADELEWRIEAFIVSLAEGELENA